MSRSGEIVLRSSSEDFLGKIEKSLNEEWRVDIPSSIDVRPMGKEGTNAYAQMGSSHEADEARLDPGESCFMLMIQ